MRYSPSSILALSLTAIALSACGSSEVKTGSLTQRFTLMDAQGVHFGVVEMDPVGGGRITDVQGRLVGTIVPPAPVSVAQMVPQAPLQPIPGM